MTEGWTMTFNYASAPLSLNRELQRFAKARVTRELRQSAAVHARAKGIPALGRCRVTLTWFVVDQRRRDVDNVWPTIKPLCDGLVDAGVVHDDTPELMEKHVAIQHVPRAEGGWAHFELHVGPL